MKWWHHLTAAGLVGLLLPVPTPHWALIVSGAAFGVGVLKWLLVEERYVALCIIVFGVLPILGSLG